MRVIRFALVLLLAAVSTAVVMRVAIPRWQCNLEKGRINRDVRRMSRSGDEYARIASARANVAKCRECIALFPQDHQFYLLLAANLRILGERDEAIATLKHAITLVERPEMWAQIGELEIERGNPEAGRAAIMTAATFQIFYIDWVSEPMRHQIQNAIMERYNRLHDSVKK
ncbi:MAG: hypothetical protein ACJ74H_07445 [Thermoanaerobaculia bacterium]